MWWNERFTSWMCIRQICSNCMMLSYQYGPKSLRNVSNTLLKIWHEDLRQFWRQKGVLPCTSKVYLIKWPVSVCVYIYIYYFIFFLLFSIYKLYRLDIINIIYVCVLAFYKSFYLISYSVISVFFIYIIFYTHVRTYLSPIKIIFFILTCILQ